MEKTYIKEGRFIPSASHATETERLQAVEAFLMRFSEETEYTLTRLVENVRLLSERDSQGGEVAQ